MLSQKIKEHGLSLGFDLVGIAPAGRFDAFADEMLARQEMYSWVMNSRARLLEAADAQNVLPGAKSIIVTVESYLKKTFPDELLGKVGKAYQYRYSTVQSGELPAKLKGMAAFLQDNGCRVESRAEVPARRAAARAGLVTFGRNTFAYADGMGSYLWINCFVVDKELEYDHPQLKLSCPDNCRKCIDACPTGALYEPLRMNPLKCIAFNSYANETFTGGISWDIPGEIREKMGSWIFGCDHCQDACPRNHAVLKQKLPGNPILEEFATSFTLTGLLEMDEELFKRVRPMTYYIPDKKFIQRNAAIALGNQKRPDTVPALRKALSNGDECVREAAAWALGRICGK